MSNGSAAEMPLPVYIASALMDLEAVMRAAALWESEAPPSSALLSQQPFCVDTLLLPQWLQFVFIPRMRELIDTGATLPDSCAIAPMVEEYGRGRGLRLIELVLVLERIDAALSNAAAGGRS